MKTFTLRLRFVALLFCGACLFGLNASQPRASAAVAEQALTAAGTPTGLNPTPLWFTSNNGYYNVDVAWGDVDGDGDLDLAAGNHAVRWDPPSQDFPYPTALFLNEEGVLQTTPAWVSTERTSTWAIAWADVDRDGDLDLAVSSDDPFRDDTDVIYLYQNENGVLESGAGWRSQDGGAIDIAWGDMNGDGYPELAAADEGNGPNRIYRNANGRLEPLATWRAAEPVGQIFNTESIAWGDMNGDGWLDLAIGNYQQPSQVYLNQQGELSLTSGWSSGPSDRVMSIAWGDMDRDGHLDLAMGSADWNGIAEYIKIYRNLGSQLETQPSWIATETDEVRMLTWGDMDNDGDWDLAVGNNQGFDKIYFNTGQALEKVASWQSVDTNITSSVAWGDMDGDGDLDLAAGGIVPKIYQNEGMPFVADTPLTIQAPHHFPLGQPDKSSRALAWGDLDHDDDLDLAVNSNDHILIFQNTGQGLAVTPVWQSTESANTHSLALGDVDGDGDLDLAVGNDRGDDPATVSPVRVYRNLGNGQFEATASWQALTSHWTWSVAWGDVDNDGDLDLAVGNWGQQNQIYFNINGELQPSPDWLSADLDQTKSLAWGDVDGDGDLDLAAGNQDQPNTLYLNVGGRLQTTPVWHSNDRDKTWQIAWGDVDNDGDLDLAAGNEFQPNKVYLNVNGMLQTDAAWSSNDGDQTRTVNWGDIDGDGDLDLAVGNWADYDKIYRNDRGQLTPIAAWATADGWWTYGSALVDVDGDGDLDFTTANEEHIHLYTNRQGAKPDDLRNGATTTAIRAHLTTDPIVTFSGQMVDTLAPANFYATPGIQQNGVISITYSLFQPNNLPMRQVRAFYSVNGGGQWYPAKATADTITTTLQTSLYPTHTVTNTHIFKWDVVGSGFFGQSDNVVVRLEALPSLRGFPNQAGGSFLTPFVATQTFPFRVRGSQVRVVAPNQTPIANAAVYRLPATQSGQAQPYADQQQRLVHTDAQGYLQGRGDLGLGDQLIALWPVTATKSYTLYYTSAAPNPTTLDTYPVNRLGVQTLTVAAQNPLLLFNLDIALEWDARQEQQWLAQLQSDLHRTATFLFDWSNGQATLGRVRLYHDAKRYPEVSDWQPWLSAHIRIYANNRLRPSATQGGIVEYMVVDPEKGERHTYPPGQVYIGANWNRYGDVNGVLGEDWPRVLAHELSHYLFFLDDNYLGFNAANLLVPITDCPGVMADPYRDEMSEYHPVDGWLDHCAHTLSHQETGRADWATIQLFYPMVIPPTMPFDNRFGPNTLPLAVTQIETLAPPVDPTLLTAPVFYPTFDGAGVVANRSARAILFQDEWLIDLGSPGSGQILARGARQGDRLCLFDLTATRLGCKTIVANDSSLPLMAFPDWQPELLVTPVTSTTIGITVGNLPAGLTLNAHLYGVSNPASDVLTLMPDGLYYRGTFSLPEATLEGYIQLWVEEPAPRREAVVDFALGGNPGRIMPRGGRILARGGRILARGGRILSRGAPVISGDGQVILYTDDHNFDPEQEWFYTLQAATTLPSLPAWATVVGRGYWLTASPTAPALQRAAITFNYLGGDVPAGSEHFLALYFWNGATWQKLPTTVDPNNNYASAASQGAGLYALLSSIPFPLPNVGWNQFVYPVQATQPITVALLSIKGAYTTVYSYVETDSLNPWRIYATTAPTWVNELQELVYNQIYWIQISRAISIEFNPTTAPPTVQAAMQGGSALAYPPATFYGIIGDTLGFPVASDMTLTAWIDNKQCGQTTTRLHDGQVVYVMDVFAEDFGAHVGCGSSAKIVSFRLNDQLLGVTAPWNNNQVTQLTFGASQTSHPTLVSRLYLPIVASVK